MSIEENFRNLMHCIVDGLTDENVKSIRYLCRDAIPHGKEFPNAHAFLEHFENKGLIYHGDLYFLAEVLYRINRHDLLKKLPGVKNRKEYERNFLSYQHTQNFTPYRIACFQLAEELTEANFNTLKTLCRDKLSTRNYQRSTDILSLLIFLEEEDEISEGDLEGMINMLRKLDNQIPFRTFQRLQDGDTSITYPKCHQPPLFSSRSYVEQTPSKAFNSSSYNNTYPDMTALHNQNQYLPGAPSFTPVYYDEHQQQKESSRDYGYPSQNSRVFDPTVYNRGPKTFIPAQYAEDTCCHGDTSSRRVVEAESFGFQSQKSSEESRRDNEDASTYMKQPNTSQTNFPSLQQRFPSEHEDTIRERHNRRQQEITSYSNSSTVLDDNNQELCRDEVQPEPRIDPDSSFTVHVAENGAEEKTESVLQTDSAFQKYPMSSKPVGICLIINNEEFSVNIAESERRMKLPGNEYQMPNSTLKDRDGSSKDVARIESLFTTFGFTIKKYINLDQRALYKTVMEHSKMDHSMYDCFVCFIMSHGSDGRVYGVDGYTVTTAKLAKAFRPDCCPSLIDKPKLFFFQACQGNNQMDGHKAMACENDIETDSPVNEALDSRTPNEADFLISHSTVPGYLSYRSKSTGSWFIERLIDNLDKHCSNEDLISILTKVNSEVASKPLKQMPMPCLTLRKKVFFCKVE